jgi:hypothetical protein
VVDRCTSLAALVREARAQLPAAAGDAAVVDAAWQGAALATLLGALARAELPPYDRCFEQSRLLATPLDGAALRAADEIERAWEAARLWHWRARTSALRAADEVDLPARWQSFDQLIAATAMRGHERGLLPAPLRGDFPAFGTVYRELAGEQLAEAESIAWERHRALEWLRGQGPSWDEVPLDT